MGLAAAQARLLTITARKSDCEAQSMRYSHQKIALSRDLADLSNRYQDSLDQTKLVYDFYGTGDESMPLSYGLLMTPSELNGYLPTLITDAAGKVVLNNSYADAARAAGIPREGLGCLPSSDIRNKFIQGLADSGIITQQAAVTYQGIQYSQAMGMGTTDLVTSTTEQMNLKELLDYYVSSLNTGCTSYEYNLDDLKTQLDNNSGRLQEAVLRNADRSAWNLPNEGSISLADVLNEQYQYFFSLGDFSEQRREYLHGLSVSVGQMDIWNWLFGELSTMLSSVNNPGVDMALEYAETQTRHVLTDYLGLYFEGDTKDKDNGNWEGVINCMNGLYNDHSEPGQGHLKSEDHYSTSDYIGITNYYNTATGNKSVIRDGVSVSITNIAYAFLTYFMQAMEGLSTSEYYVSSTQNNRTVAGSNLVSLEDANLAFDVVVSTGVNTDQALNSGFYDSMFNQICTRGWVENDRIDDNEYMQEMLKTGKFFLATCSDDGYYYQGNYSTNSYVREVTDDEAITKAEAKYNADKQRLNLKEQTLDLKMKNLDTEISSLTTEYDTVKSVISKNIEKSFKRYDA